MPETKLITVVVPICEGNPIFEGSADVVLGRINELLSTLPIEQRASASIALGVFNNHGEVDPVLRVKYKRLETEAEYQKRCSKDQELQRDVDVCERAQLKRLLLKYGSPSTGSQTRDAPHPENV